MTLATPPGRPKILVVEDDTDIAEIILAQLQNQDYEVCLTRNGHEAMAKVDQNQIFDLYILDWMLPGPSGIELCERLRKKDKTKVPILMVTARTEPQYIIDGLDAGADDYITKPFSMDVFLARVRAHLRRYLESQQKNLRPMDHELLVRGPISINEKKFEVLVEDRPLQLTISEFKILKCLMEIPGHVFTRKQLIENIAGTGIHVGGRTIDTQLVGIRKKLGEHGHLIETIRGIGYKFKEKV